jgi:membrane fusion protein (multidrug efflux system)
LPAPLSRALGPTPGIPLGTLKFAARLLYKAIFCLGLLALGACGEEGEGSQAGPQAQGQRGGQGGGRGGQWGGGPPGSTAAIPVKSEKVRRGDMAAYVQTHARLEAERQVGVLARTTGLVEELEVEEGDPVRAGQVLARLDKEELQLRVQETQVGLRQVSASYERTKVLHERRMVSEVEFETVRHQLEDAQVALEQAQLNLAYADIQAPIDGVVMQRLIELGDLVRPNQELFAVADLEPLLARIHVPEKRMHQIRQGQEARLLLESLPEEIFRGKIRMISPGVDPQSGTVKVTLEIPTDRGRLKPGMFASVHIITEVHPQTLIIPKKALIIETDEDDVFVVEEGKAKRVRLELGFTEGDQVEVVAGLKEGDEVITVGQEGLKDGTPVRQVGAELLVAAGGEAVGAEGRAGAAGDSAKAAPKNPALVALEKVLTPEQLRKLRELQSSQGEEPNLRSLMQQLELSQEQREQVRQLMGQSSGGTRDG